jgi:hypothetical protein
MEVVRQPLDQFLVAAAKLTSGVRTTGTARMTALVGAIDAEVKTIGCDCNPDVVWLGDPTKIHLAHNDGCKRTNADNAEVYVKLGAKA